MPRRRSACERCVAIKSSCNSEQPCSRCESTITSRGRFTLLMSYARIIFTMLVCVFKACQVSARVQHNGWNKATYQTHTIFQRLCKLSTKVKSICLIPRRISRTKHFKGGGNAMNHFPLVVTVKNEVSHASAGERILDRTLFILKSRRFSYIMTVG